MVSKKDKRRSGWVTPSPVLSKRDFIQYDLFLERYYDDWEDWRDGMRDWCSDFKLIKDLKRLRRRGFSKRFEMNYKQKKKLLIRRRKKQHLRNQ